MRLNLPFDQKWVSRVEARYKAVKVVLKPTASEWEFEFTLDNSTFFGTGKTYEEAMRKAERQIDELMPPS